MIESSECIINMLSEIDLLLISLNTFFEIYSIPKVSNYTAVFLSINNETQCALLSYLSSRFMTYALSFILGKLSLGETPINLGS